MYISHLYPTVNIQFSLSPLSRNRVSSNISYLFSEATKEVVPIWVNIFKKPIYNE